jgi:hypothetical protein
MVRKQTILNDARDDQSKIFILFHMPDLLPYRVPIRTTLKEAPKADFEIRE